MTLLWKLKVALSVTTETTFNTNEKTTGEFYTFYLATRSKVWVTSSV